MTIFEKRFSNILKTGEHQGIPWCVAMGPFSINGYIQLPEEHPWIELGWMEHPADVHGGVTYTSGRIQGFDTVHAGDGYHPDAPRTKEMPAETINILQLGINGIPDHVWNELEVEAEVKRFAQRATEAIA